MSIQNILALFATIFIYTTQIPFVPIYNSYSRGDIYDIPPAFIGKYSIVVFMANQMWLVLVYMFFLYGAIISISVFILSFIITPFLIKPIFIKVFSPANQVLYGILALISGNAIFLYLVISKI
jgi:hypothetical protein